MQLAYGIFYTNDIVRASNFYEEILSLEKTFGDDKFIAFKVGTAYLGIKVSELARETPGYQTVSIEVSDIDNLSVALKEKGVVFDKELTTEKWGKNFSILDSDLNKVEFFQK